MNGYVVHIEKESEENENFRKVLYTAPHSQLVVMSLKPGEDIGEEVHTLDQFIRIEKGNAAFVLNGVAHAASDGDAVVVPAGTRHNVVNSSSTEPLKLYTVYSPANHLDGTVHPTKADAMKDEEEHFDGNTTEAR